MVPNTPTNGCAAESPARAAPVATEGPAARLLRLWQRGSSPDLDAFLAESEGLAPLELAAVLRVDQRERWRLGQRVPAETYLQRYPTVRDDSEGATDLVYGEFLLREKEGAAPHLEELRWRFPHLASILQPQIELHRALQAVPSQESGVAAAQSTMQAETLGLEQAPRTDSLGPVVPGYEILGELGRGGMGVVYKARCLRLKRLVALKMLLSGDHAGPGELTRFRKEAESAARLRHPNIVQVYELGESEGRPYLALELIEGGSLKTRLGGVPQPGRWSAELLETLARAVHDAHTQGVVHRDLKPANILIADCGLRIADCGFQNPIRNPQSAIPKVTDFGLAKQFGAQASHGDATPTGNILGTPSYMSPEQAAGKSAEIGPATDVYALGSILYEMLTGRPPFLADSPLHTLQQVATDDPVSPSQLQRQLPHDLVTICLKCLRKEPAKRYASAMDLADDLRRFLNGEPIHARPVGVVERAWRCARRHPVVASLAAALILGTVGGLALMIGLYLHARGQAERAQGAEQAALTAAADEKKAKEAAEMREAETTAVLRFVENQIFAAARPKGQQGGLGREVTLRQAIEDALSFVDKSFANEPLIEARLRMTLGLSFWYRGEVKIASEQYEKARAIFTQQVGPDHRDTLLCMNDLANCYSYLGRAIEAWRLREETLALQKAKLGPDHPDTLQSMNNLAISYADVGRQNDAFNLLEEALALQKTKLGPDHPDTLRTMHNLANRYDALGRPQDAFQLRQETLTRRKAKLGPDHPDTLQSMYNLAFSYAALGWPQDALQLYEETLTRRKVVLGPDHPDTLGNMQSLANSYADLGRHKDALPLYEETVTRLKAVHGPDHSDTLNSMHNLANSYDALGRPQDALELREEMLPLQKAKHGPDHPHTLLGMWGMAESLVALDRGTEAVRVIDECVRRAAGQRVHPRLIPDMMDMRLRHFEKAKDAAGCRATAEMWEKLNRTDADSLYAAACLRAVAAAVLRATDKSEEAAKQADAEAARAMEFLKQAVAAGYKNGAHMKKDKDLDVLRGRPEFKELLADLEKKPSPAPSPP